MSDTSKSSLNPKLLTSTYETFCSRRGIAPNPKIRQALLGACAVPRKLQFSNLSRELTQAQWDVVHALFKSHGTSDLDTAENAPFLFPLPQTLTEVQMNSLAAGDAHGAKLLDFLLPRVSSVEMLSNALGTASARVIARALAKTGDDAVPLRRLKLGDNGFTAGDIATMCKPLAQPTAMIQQLHLAENRIGDTGAQHVANALASNASLTSLCLRDTNITERGMRAIAEAVASNPLTEMCELDMKKNNLGDASMPSIAALLRFCPKLTILDISQCGLTSEGCGTLASALGVNCTLRHLVVSSNNITDAGMGALCTALGRPLSHVTALHADECSLTRSVASDLKHLIQNTLCLRRLSLGDNDLGDECARAIAAGLKSEGNRLLQLTAPRCSIGPRGLAVILDSVQSHAHLRSVDISQNHIGGGFACTALCDMLEGNRNIVRLHFSDNGIPSDGMERVVRALDCNRVVRNCIFGGQSNNSNNVTQEQRCMINDILKRNKSLIPTRGSKSDDDDPRSPPMPTSNDNSGGANDFESFVPTAPSNHSSEWEHDLTLQRQHRELMDDTLSTSLTDEGSLSPISSKGGSVAVTPISFEKAPDALSHRPVATVLPVDDTTLSHVMGGVRLFETY